MKDNSMEAFIKLSAEERNLYCRQAPERMKIPLPSAVIEKDFWICWTLKILNEIPELKSFSITRPHLSLSQDTGRLTAK
jgi:hypothetical protein